MAKGDDALTRTSGKLVFPDLSEDLGPAFSLGSRPSGSQRRARNAASA